MLSWFASDYFSQSPVLIFPIVALGLFMTVFMVMSLRAIFARKPALDRMAQLPLESDDE